MWLNEGVASFEGGSDGYRRVCAIPEIARILEALPSIATLESSYHRLRAADVISFTLIDFIVTSGGGMSVLNELLRNPASLERLLGGSTHDIEIRWQEFAKTRYR